MKKPRKSIWFRSLAGYFGSDRGETSADLAFEPIGGPTKQWLAGALLPAAPFLYGLVGLVGDHTMLLRRRNNLNITGVAAEWLSIAYLAAAAFFHFHYFWGLSPCLLLVFLPSFLYALYQIL